IPGIEVDLVDTAVRVLNLDGPLVLVEREHFERLAVLVLVNRPHDWLFFHRHLRALQIFLKIHGVSKSSHFKPRSAACRRTGPFPVRARATILWLRTTSEEQPCPR